MHRNSAILFSILVFLSGAQTVRAYPAGEAHYDKRHFTVSDSIQMTQIVEPNLVISRIIGSAPDFNVSPNGQYFAFVTRTGNVATGHTDYKLIVHKTSEILEFVNNEIKVPIPEGSVVVALSSATNEAAIRLVRWLPDSNSIVFIGETPDQRLGQVYAVNIATRETYKLTDHPREVESFDMNILSGRIIYLAKRPIYHKGRDKTHYVVGLNSRADEVRNIDAELQSQRLYQYYTLGGGQKEKPKELGDPFFQASIHDIWLSPNGRWAIGIQAIQQTRSDWMDDYFVFSNNGYLRARIESFDEYTASDRYSHTYQYVLINLDSGAIEPIFDAPTGPNYGGYLHDVRWLPDSETVILANTFLPLEGVSVEERKRRRQSPATVEFRISTGEITRIMDHVIPVGENSAPEKFAGMEVAEDGTLVLKRWGGGRQQGGYLSDKHFRKAGGKWRASDFVPSKQQDANRLDVSVREGLNTPPEIVAWDLKTGNKKIITDLNPQFRKQTFGRVEGLTWTDASGLSWEAGLVYPVGYVVGERYPLVIQTHGFYKDQFLIDGPSAGPFSAQALSNKGILVLQTPDRSVGQPDEREIHRIGIEGAIDTLDEMGLIGRDKVGLIGYSGTGHIIQHIITYSDFDFKAATVADAFNVGRSGYASFYGSPFGMASVERRMGAVPWGEELLEWVKEDPELNLDRVKTPLRLEQYSTRPKSWWETYVILRRQQKPVEFIVVPYGKHALVKPLERYVIQQGNVDWFDFWLNGHDRVEPYPNTRETVESLAEQYERWRKLRELQEKSEVDAIKARKWHKEQEAKREQYEQWLIEQAASDDSVNAKDAVNE